MMSVCFPVGTHGVYQRCLRSLDEWKKLCGISGAAGLESGWQLHGRRLAWRLADSLGKPRGPAWGLLLQMALSCSSGVGAWELCACVCTCVSVKWSGRPSALWPWDATLQGFALHGNWGSDLPVCTSNNINQWCVFYREMMSDECDMGQRGRAVLCER